MQGGWLPLPPLDVKKEAQGSFDPGTFVQMFLFLRLFGAKWGPAEGLR